MLPWVVNYRQHPRTSRRPCLRCSNKHCQISFTSLTICNSFTLNSFADPHPLNPELSILYKKGGGRGAISGRTSEIFCFPYTLPSSVCCNSFVCHSYENCRGVYQQFPFWSISQREELMTAATVSSTSRASSGFCYPENDMTSHSKPTL